MDLTESLRAARARCKCGAEGIHATANYHRQVEGCPVNTVRIGIHELIGAKPFHGPNLCPRCRTPLHFDG